MHRLLVALLAAFDAVIAAAAAIAVVLAPLTLLWVLGMGSPDWAALWPASAAVWQLGNLVPLPVTLPDAYIALTGISGQAASFTLSLAPLAFASFTAIFAARSGARAVGASGWVTGVLTGGVVFASLAALIALTSRNPVAHPRLWQAVLFPALLYVLSALAGAIVTAWRDGDHGLIDRIRARAGRWPGKWSVVPGLAVRGSAVALVGMIGLGSLGVAVSLMLHGVDVIALYEAGQVDALGATLVTLGQLMFLPTLVVWALSWIAGPGFALGVGTAVSPGGTQVGVVPGIPILGIVPETVSSWILLVLLLPIAVGALAGWVVRSRLVSARSLGSASGHEALLPRLILTLVIAVLSGAGGAILAMVASGGIGPGRLSAVGPEPGPVALAIGLEVLVGAAILLLSPRRRDSGTAEGDPLGEPSSSAVAAAVARPAPLPPID